MAQTPYYRHGALAIGVIPVLLSVNAIFRPEAALNLAAFPVPAEPSARKLTRSLMRFYGTRNVAIGFMSLLVWHTGDDRLLGLSLLPGVFICVVDGIMSKLQIGGGEWNHWSLAPVIIGIAGKLLRWS
ncbi:Uu.00g119900.m01.CDS01 [Anthostomella pinea]|uniref:Uu.00g119900.m01.CDS01 n=1 Tax=Anthostomella pinea TaxID=933095 RepID=A0AAI8VH79_9PEZI|nr:Uu.00g119900.m01.CDS01 [Anthostomella pinea]